MINNNLITFDLGGLNKSLSFFNDTLADLSKRVQLLEQNQDQPKKQEVFRPQVLTTQANNWCTQEQLTALDNSQKQTNQAVERLTKTVQALHTASQATEENHYKHEDKINDIDNSLVPLMQKIVNTEKQISDQKTQMQQSFDAKIIQLNDMLSAKQKQIDSLEINSKKINSELKTQDDAVKRLSKLIEKVDTVTNEFKDEIEEAKQKLDQQSLQVDELRQTTQQGLTTKDDDLLNDPLAEIKFLVRQQIQDHNPQTITDLARIVINSIKDEGKSLKFNHLPSVVQQVIEDHVRQVGNHVVYLQRIRPKFRNFEIGSEINQVFSHVEVQTYQQSQLLKQYQQFDLNMLQMKLQVDHLQNEFKRFGRYIDDSDEGRNVDLTILLQDVKPDHKEIASLITEMKSDLLHRTPSKLQISNIEQRMSDLELKIMSANGGVSKEINSCIEQMQTFPQMLQALQVQIMRTDTNMHDLQRTVSIFQKRLNEFGQLEKEVKSTQQAISSGHLSEQQKHAEKQELQQKLLFSIQLATKGQFDQIESEMEIFQSAIKTLQNETRLIQQKVQDNTKGIKTNEKLMQKTQSTQEELRIVSEQVLKELKLKVDQSEYEDEIRQINGCFSGLDGAGKILAKSRPQPKKVPGGNGVGQGMSKQEKQQLADLVTAQETIQLTLRTLQSTIAKFSNPDEMNSKLKQLNDKASKGQVDALQLELMSEISTVKGLIKDAMDDQDKLHDRAQNRITRVFEQFTERDEKFDSLQTQVNRIEDDLVKIKRKGQGADIKRKLMLMAAQTIDTYKDQQSQPQPVSQMADDDEPSALVDQKFTKICGQMQQKLDEQEEKIRQLIRQLTGEEKNNKLKAEIKKFDDKMTAFTQDQIVESERLNKEVADLKKTFEEKIRRQALVKEKKQAALNSDEELMKELKSKPKFLASQLTRELILNGRLPQLENYGEHLARYGKGFSQMLNVAADTKPLQTHSTFEGSRLMEGFSMSNLLVQDQQETQGAYEDQYETLSQQDFREKVRNLNNSTQLIENPFSLASPRNVNISKRRSSNRSHLIGKKKQSVQVSEDHQILQVDKSQLTLPQLIV